MVATQTEQEQLRFGLTAACVADIQRVLALHPRLDKAVLFGSRAMGTYKNGSDIDLALLGEQLTYDDVITLYGQLDELPYAYTYDLIDYNKISNPAVEAHIDDLGIVFYEKEQSLLPTGWKECKLDDLGIILNSKRIPLNSREREVRKGIYPYYGASGIVDYIDDFIFESEHVLISEDGENLRSRQTPIAFKADGKFWVNNHAHIFKGYNKFINDYIVYFFKNSDINPYITGAVQPKLNKENLLSIPIKIPAEDELEQMVEILRSFDDKIELNRQMNQTLETIAQTLFTEWFVRFNFPDFDGELVDGLPKGWRMGTLGELCSNIRNSVQPQEVLFDTPYIGLEHIPRKSLSITNWGRSQQVESQKLRYKTGDVLFGKLRPYFHKVAIAPTDGICSTDILVIRPRRIIYNAFLINYLFSDDIISYVSGIADGTRMPRVDWLSVANYEIVIPDDNTLSHFEELAKPVYTKIINSSFENQALTQLRDSLLPKLMSGKISVGADA